MGGYLYTKHVYYFGYTLHPMRYTFPIPARPPEGGMRNCVIEENPSKNLLRFSTSTSMMQSISQACVVTPRLNTVVHARRLAILMKLL